MSLRARVGGLLRNLALRVGGPPEEGSGQGSSGQDALVKQFRVRARLQKQEIEGLRALMRSKEEGSGVGAADIVWIFGTARTGSTWLASIMGELRGNQVWNEPFAGTLFAPTFYRLHWESTIGRPRSAILSADRRSIWLGAARSLVLDMARANFPDLDEEATLIIKDPHGSVGAPTMMEALPESRIALLLRDPRDVAASILASSGKSGWRKTWEQTDDPDEIVRIRAELYLESVGRAKEAYEAHAGRKALVRYEDLRAEPLANVRKVCADLGIEASEGEVAAAIELHSWENVPAEKKGEGKFYRKATPGGWREDLTKRQIEIVERVAAPLLTEFYPE